jgi:hypothetical protein
MQYINDYFTVHLRTAKRNPSETFNVCFIMTLFQLPKTKCYESLENGLHIRLRLSVADLKLRGVTAWFLQGEKRRETLIYLSVVSMLADEYGFGAILLGYNCVLMKTLLAV